MDGGFRRREIVDVLRIVRRGVVGDDMDLHHVGGRVSADSSLVSSLSIAVLRDLDHHCQPSAALRFGVVVGRVMSDVAMNKPFAWLSGLPYDVVALTRPDIDRVRLEPRLRGKGLPVARHNRERTAVHMHRMNEIVVAADEA